MQMSVQSTQEHLTALPVHVHVIPPVTCRCSLSLLMDKIWPLKGRVEQRPPRRSMPYMSPLPFSSQHSFCTYFGTANQAMQQSSYPSPPSTPLVLWLPDSQHENGGFHYFQPQKQL